MMTYDVIAVSQKCDVCAVTPLGKVLGAIVEAPQGGYVEEYLGVPFAQPPVGQLRFADPVPLIRLPQGKLTLLCSANCTADVIS